MNNLKNIIKKIPGVKFLIKLRKYKDFNKDRNLFLNNYMYAEPYTKEKIEYDMLLEIHKLEKGFAVINPRPFGIDKVDKIMFLIKKYESLKFDKSFSYNMACSSLEKYIEFYEDHNWTHTEQYANVKSFMTMGHEYEYVEVGAFDLQKKDFIDKSNIDYDSFLSSRRSIRNFAAKHMDEKDVIKATKMAIKSPSACNRQMCKLYYINNEENKKVIEKYAQGLGLFDLTNANYAVITFDVSANYFVGERNQGWFNAGLFTMNFVNALHSIGIGSCCIQWGNTFKEEQDFKKLLNIPNTERVAIIVTFGYYDEVSRIPYSTRKPIEEIYSER